MNKSIQALNHDLHMRCTATEQYQTKVPAIRESDGTIMQAMSNAIAEVKDEILVLKTHLQQLTSEQETTQAWWHVACSITDACTVDEKKGMLTKRSTLCSLDDD